MGKVTAAHHFQYWPTSGYRASHLRWSLQSSILQIDHRSIQSSFAAFCRYLFNYLKPDVDKQYTIASARKKQPEVVLTKIQKNDRRIRNCFKV